MASISDQVLVVANQNLATRNVPHTYIVIPTLPLSWTRVIRIRTGSDTGTVIASTSVNVLGEYAFASVNPGNRYYLSATYGVNTGIPANPAAPAMGYAIADGERLIVNFSGNVSGSGKIKGIVSNNYGPLADVTISIRRGPQTNPILSQTQTDSAGRYTFVGLQTGISSPDNNYTVVASKAPYLTVTSTPSIAVTDTIPKTRNIILGVVGDPWPTPDKVKRPKSKLSAKFYLTGLGDQTIIELSHFDAGQMVEILSVNGTVEYRIRIPEGVSQALLPINSSRIGSYVIRVR